MRDALPRAGVAVAPSAPGDHLGAIVSAVSEHVTDTPATGARNNTVENRKCEVQNGNET